MKKKKIGLIISGGVSLGSYEAGVLTEILYALETLNKQHGENVYELDVMTGASAGSMTAALTARIMMYDLSGKRQNLYRAWVKDIDLQYLLQNPPDNALLSKKVIEKIADDYILGTDWTEINRASFAPETLHLGFRMSNLHGTDYRIQYQVPKGAPGFPTTHFADSAQFKLGRENLSNPQTWKEIQTTAIASGNFPVAFQPQRVLRTAADYPGSEQAKEPDYFDRELFFVDGGLFNNEPLRDAIHLAANADGGVYDPNRLFILIDPNINRKKSKEDIDSNFSLKDLVMRLIVMALGESVAKDWMKADKINNKIDWSKDFAQSLADLLNQSVIPKTMPGLVNDTAKEIIRKKNDLLPGRYDNSYLDKSLDKIEMRHADLIEKMKGNDDSGNKREVFRNLMFVVNNAAGIQNKSKVNLALIGSNKDETAGDQMAGFAGFFREEWRIHDYRQGRIKAHKLIKEFLKEDYPQESNTPDYLIPREWENFPKVEVKDAPKNLRKKLRKVAVDRVMEILEDHTHWSYRWLIKFFLVKKQLNSFLKL